MSNSGEKFVVRGDDAIEALLENAAPRPTPPTQDEKIVREAVRAEWQATTGKIKMRRRMTHFAIAATVLLGIAVTFNALQLTNVKPVQVATISNSHGSIYLLGEQSELREMTDLASIFAGQVIDTGDDAGIGLEWGNGGSLRIDKNARIEFTSADSVYLHSGQIYFDSQPSDLTASISGGSDEIVAAITGSGFEIETDHGLVSHRGTQYMTSVGGGDLTVSVREGEVVVDGVYIEKAIAVAGQRMTLSGGARPSVLDIDGFGGAWDWIEEMAPSANVDGRTVDEFLTWIARETGLQISYASPEAANTARNGVLRGNVDMAPRDELAFRMSGEDLGYRIDGGTIYVSIDSGSRP